MWSSTRPNDRTRHRVVILLALALAAVLAAAPLIAAGDDAQHLTVPLSDPGKPAHVDVGLVLGSIRVVAGSAGQVVIEAQQAPRTRTRTKTRTARTAARSPARPRTSPPRKERRSKAACARSPTPRST